MTINYTASEYLALYGTRLLLQVVGIIRKRINPDLNMPEVVITQYGDRKYTAAE